MGKWLLFDFRLGFTLSEAQAESKGGKSGHPIENIYK